MDMYTKRRLLPASVRRLQTVSFQNDGVTYRKALAYAMQKRKETASKTQPNTQYKLLVLKSNQPDEAALNQAILANNLAMWLRSKAQAARKTNTDATKRSTARTTATVLSLQSSSRITRRTSSVSAIPSITNKYAVPRMQHKMKTRVRLSPPNIVKSIKCMFQREGENMGCLDTLLSLVGTTNSLILRELAYQSFSTLVQLR
eukprot:TRINITY_DN1479_c0_g1_i2.p1 TRINITY_DN1479_c0_g1~~TRINITY_DN1479_c0_g1_i2.p1  ORF type:complete len:202 (-),score=31.23 TRINITY_DN1479_c0_g1_i2:446-1051(-)